MKESDFRMYGEKENHRLLVRLTKTQKQRIKFLAEAEGYKTMSNFVRIHLLNPSFDEKLNLILQSLKKLEEIIPPCKCRKQADEPRSKK